MELLKKCFICLSNKSNIENYCSSQHYYCSECINQNYEFNLKQNRTILNECSICKEKFDETKLEKILKPDVLNMLKQAKAINIKLNVFEEFGLTEDDYIIKCPVCIDVIDPGMILVNRTDYIQFYRCEKENCKKEICLYCLREKSNLPHEKCKKYFGILLDLEKVIEYGMLNKCPKCKVRIINYELNLPTIKDGSCTHIKCNKCPKSYCYICGGHEDKIDKSEELRNAPIYRHNIEWHLNEKRCPMYIKEFSKYCSGWPAEEKEATIKLEKYKINFFLKKVIDKHTLPNTLQCFETFSSNRLKLLHKDYFELQKTFVHFPFIDSKLISYYNFN